MTLVAEPPVGVDAPAAASRVQLRRSPLGTWRFAARLARREVRRRPGRSALVAAMIAVPVMAMGVASIISGTSTRADAEAFERRSGGADIVAEVWGDVVSDEAVAGALPAGATWSRTHGLHVPVRTVDGDEEPVYLTDLDLSSPLAAGAVDVRHGEIPVDGEVLLSRELAAELGMGVGDRLELARPEGTWTVSGIGRLRDDHARPLLVMPDLDITQVRPDHRAVTLRVGLADDSTVAIEAAANGLATALPVDRTVETAQRTGAGRVPPSRLAWGWVAGTIALGAVGVIVAAAFATSARRQVGTIGQLAANGAPSSLIRRTLALQGSWTGLVGGLGGLAGTAVLGVAAVRPFMQRVAGRDVGPIVVSPAQLGVVLATAVLVATLAALVPARGAARIPVMAALAGRRPLGAVPRRLVPIGLALFGGGLGLLAASAAAANDQNSNGDLVAAVAVAGGLAVLAGTCCATPLAVDVLRRVPVGGSWRLARRGLVRQRTRAAAVVTAIATVGAISIAAATVAGREVDARRDPGVGVPTVPRDAVLVQSPTWTEPDGTVPPIDVPPVPDATLDALHDVLPDAEVHALRTAAPAGRGPRDFGGEMLLVADPALLDLIGLADVDADSLRRVGILAMNDWDLAGADGLMRVGGRPVEVATRVGLPATLGGYTAYLVTPDRAAELGWTVVDAGVILRNGAPLTETQRNALDDLNGFGGESPWVADRGALAAGSYWIQYASPSYEVVPQLVEGAIVLTALLLTLLVVAIGLALSAAESRDERDVLVAVGARPATMRRLAACRAVALTVVAAVLAIPTGYVPIVVVYRAVEGEVAAFPWLTAAGILVAVPLLAGGAAWITSSIAQRFRPVRMSNLAVD